jgi:hypothetical protein
MAQRDLRIPYNDVLSSRVELPRQGRGEERGEYKSTAQEGSPKHGCTAKEYYTRDKTWLYLWTQERATTNRNGQGE